MVVVGRWIYVWCNENILLDVWEEILRNLDVLFEQFGVKVDKIRFFFLLRFSFGEDYGNLVFVFMFLNLIIVDVVSVFDNFFSLVLMLLQVWGQFLNIGVFCYIKFLGFFV